MAQQTIAANAEKIVDVPYGESIAIGTWGGGIAKIYYETTPGSIPPSFYFVQNISNEQVTLGTFARDQKVKIEAGDNDVLYDVGVSPDVGVGDASTLNGLTSSQFLRSDANDSTLSTVTFRRPSNSWTSDGHFYLSPGGLYSGGSNRITLTSNHYRNNAGGSTYLGQGGFTDKGSAVDLDPGGTVFLRGGTASGVILPTIVEANYDTDLYQFKGQDIYHSGYGSLGGFRNVILNGNMNVWQYLTSYAGVTTGIVTADKWWSNPSGATLTYSRQAFTPGQTDVPGEPEYYIRCDATVADNSWGIVQKVEDVRTLASEMVTLSFYAKGSTTSTIRILLRQQFGSGGSTSVDIANTDNSLAAGNVWTKYTLTTTLGSMSGQTIGANNALWVFILNDDNTTGTLDISQVQLERGPVATPFEQRPYVAELSMCQRYRWRNTAINGGNGYFYGAAGNVLMTAAFASFPTEMRTAPTMTITTTPTYTNCTPNVVTSSNTGFIERVDVTATGVFRASGGSYLAEADII